jgi:hypothetical protein
MKLSFRHPSKLAATRLCTLLLAMGLLALAGCSSGGPPTTTSVAPVVGVTPDSGTPQSHSVNGPFGTPLVAMVTSNGLPVSGIVVTFTAPASGPSGTFAGGGVSSKATSEASGLATSQPFTANSIVGSYEVMASAPTAPALAAFDLTNTTGAPAAITATAGNGQSAPINNAFVNPLQVTVVDSGQNPVSSAVVVFAAPATGASGAFSNPSGTSGSTTSTTAITNASGVATAGVFTANTIAGSDSVTATVAGVSAAATFTLTNLPGQATNVTAISGTPQNAIGDKQFAAPLTVSVTDNQNNPVSGAVVTFTAQTTPASGTFQDSGTNTTTATTNSSGIAASAPFTANATAGTYAVTASSGGTAIFTLTNWPVGSQYYSFYLSGQEDLQQGSVTGLYVVAGSVAMDPSGNVLAGEQDYNDAAGHSSPEPSGDAITGGTLKLGASNHQGTLTLNTNNLNIGVGGVETLGIQFVNSNHALVVQFDGSATSSGSLDLQTLPGNTTTSNLTGGYAFTLTGEDPVFFPVAYGGVFTIAPGGLTLQNGVVDTNDEGIGTPSTGAAFTGTLSLPDSFGRGTLTTTINYDALEGVPSPIAFNYYVVGPEVIRIIGVDSTDFAVGSAYGQGSNSSSASNTSLATSVFGLSGINFFSDQFAAAGMFTPTASSGTFAGIGDDNELSFGFQVPDSAISGTYAIAGNGYGSFLISGGALGSVTTLGLYVTDPNLNLLDPNTPGGNGTGLGGGALLLDLDPAVAGGTGLMLPQTDNTTTDFTGSYAFGLQDDNFSLSTGILFEFDLVGEGAMTSGTLKGTALISDPGLTLGGNATIAGVKVQGVPLPDPSNAGRYTMLSTNSPQNPLQLTVSGTVKDFDVVMYQANGGQLIWVDEDPSDVFLGTLQQFGSFTTLPKSGAATGRSKSK